ncbi:putative muscle M-line assembly protein unc-89 [Apostichopus japonicus]|uniref:Putative muscle M-line assembly protein unc-89 n=1 Tax=Stichopus japonicus TaxID=307972 RepID=A0A2G8LKZ6_STIJA|nr:putative muscle M-line assembly protein unc-89 [Apostichopus japonicus]
MVGRGKANEAPKFTAPIKSINADEGQSASLQADVSGKPQPDIKWYKDGEELTPSRDYDMTFKLGRAVLKITKVKAKHVGTYKCEASNESGKAECTAQLQTKGSSQSPQFTQKLESQVTSEGKSVRFEVTVSGAPPPTVTWSHNGDILENSVDIQIKQEGDKHSLFIPEVFDDDAGKYIVKAESSTGMATCEATLVVNRRPSPTTTRTAVTQATPPAEEQAPPPPPQEEIQKTEESVVEASPAAPPQAAPKATPQSPPKFVKTLTDVKTKEGSPVRLECVVKGVPEPEIQWLRENIPVDPSPDFDMVYQDGKCVMNIHEIYLDDAGKFTCTATNAAGTVSTSSQLVVEAAAPAVPATPAAPAVPAAQAAPVEVAAPPPPPPPAENPKRRRS